MTLLNQYTIFAIKIGSKRSEFFKQGRGVRQGCSLSPTLFNIYINELAVMLEQSASPGLTLHDTEVKFLLYADDLVLLSPTEQGLQQSLSLIEQYCQRWALTVNLEKTRVMVFQRKARSQGNGYHFTLGDSVLEHSTSYTYLGLAISAAGNFNLAIKDLKEKAHRAFYAIKHKLPIRIWLKMYNSIITPILLYGSEVWGPISNPEFKNWDNNPAEQFQLEFSKNILQIHRNAPNNACRAELGLFPLHITIQKRAIKFWHHLNKADQNALNYKKALLSNRSSQDNVALDQMAPRITEQSNIKI